MANYKVVRRFKDTKHNGHIYEVGDEYPVTGKRATKARLEELSTTANSYNAIFIEPSTEEE